QLLARLRTERLILSGVPCRLFFFGVLGTAAVGCAAQRGRADDLNSIAYDGRVYCGHYSTGAMCLVGDSVVYKDYLTDAGVRVRSYAIPGVAEYMRVIEFPDGGSVQLERCMTDRWSDPSSIPPEVLAENPAPEVKGCYP
ncbi:MAG TPA: hypothetical protein VMK42_03090, partial [Anaeromyxobacteraceae bacterium]|nr:hypothetical protein [Anaeromyxobacteraceae bacterium]